MVVATRPQVAWIVPQLPAKGRQTAFSDCPTKVHTKTNPDLKSALKVICHGSPASMDEEHRNEIRNFRSWKSGRLAAGTCLTLFPKVTVKGSLESEKGHQTILKLEYHQRLPNEQLSSKAVFKDYPSNGSLQRLASKTVPQCFVRVECSKMRYRDGLPVRILT